VYDAIIVGGGPAGSVCARTLTRAGARVVVVDRAEFPRVKLCAGWLSPPFWDLIERSPREYPHGLWEWNCCHVHYRGGQYSVAGRGWFIRRYELDDWLLRESGAELRLGINIKSITRDSDTWQVGDLRARYLVGAGGTHCPVARMLDPVRPRRAVGVQELELQADPGAIARTRLGADGEPELVLFDGLSGYGWNVPKRDWLNVGCGTLDATAVRDAWTGTHALLRDAGHIPAEAEPQLAHVKGHSYFLFDPAHLAAAHRDGAFLIGDSLGLAHPLTAEGIVPAVTSGRLCAEAIVSGHPASYPARVREHELLTDYARVHRIAEAVRVMRRKRAGAARDARGHGRDGGRHGGLADRVVAHGFAWLFSGARMPAPRVLDFVLDHLPIASSDAARPRSTAERSEDVIASTAERSAEGIARGRPRGVT
jgi:menaquinone-9 beta-reductase